MFKQRGHIETCLIWQEAWKVLLHCSARALGRLHAQDTVGSSRGKIGQNWTPLIVRWTALLHTKPAHYGQSVATRGNHCTCDRNFQNADGKKQRIATVRCGKGEPQEQPVRYLPQGGRQKREHIKSARLQNGSYFIFSGAVVRYLTSPFKRGQATCGRNTQGPMNYTKKGETR